MSWYRINWVPTFTLPLTVKVHKEKAYGTLVEGTADELIAAGILNQQIVDEMPKSGTRSVYTPVGRLNVRRMAKCYRVDIWDDVMSFLLTAAMLRPFGVTAQPDDGINIRHTEWLYDPRNHFEYYC